LFKRGGKSLKTGLIAITVVITVIVVGAAILSNNVIGGSKTINIVDGLITVGAGSYQAYPFTNTGEAGELAHVRGNFTVSSGTENDIIVLIMDNTAFTNWTDGQQVSVYYDSGQLNTDNFNVNLTDAGSYYLVFSNTFSLLAGKDVQAHVDIVYVW
jgi:hypothetical protein